MMHKEVVETNRFSIPWIYEKTRISKEVVKDDSGVAGMETTPPSARPRGGDTDLSQVARGRRTPIATRSRKRPGGHGIGHHAFGGSQEPQW